jgi:hypothetical protein
VQLAVKSKVVTESSSDAAMNSIFFSEVKIEKKNRPGFASCSDDYPVLIVHPQVPSIPCQIVFV